MRLRNAGIKSLSPSCQLIAEYVALLCDEEMVRHRQNPRGKVIQNTRPRFISSPTRFSLPPTNEELLQPAKVQAREQERAPLYMSAQQKQQSLPLQFQSEDCFESRAAENEHPNKSILHDTSFLSFRPVRAKREQEEQLFFFVLNKINPQKSRWKTWIRHGDVKRQLKLVFLKVMNDPAPTGPFEKKKKKKRKK